MRDERAALVEKLYAINTKADMFSALGHHGQRLYNVNGRIGYLRAVEREDGSGDSFNIILTRDGVEQRVYKRF